MKLRLRNPSALQWTIIVASGTLVLGVAGAAYARRRSASRPVGPELPPGKRDPKVDPNSPGSGPIDPGPNNEGPRPTKKGWGGGQYGAGQIPADFDWNGNLIFFSPNCKTIAEGWLFLPIPGWQEAGNWWMPANGGPSAQGSLADALTYVSPNGETGTAWGYVARLAARAARDGVSLDLEYIANQVLEEALAFQAVPPNCPNISDPASWNKYPVFKTWYDNFLKRLEHGLSAFEAGWYHWNPYWEVS
ncbi:MAG: hypothetical protein K0U16_07235 [Gammaproteobacteria bacterium]|nr:hypothetical protein [Gammaproteobacteria bacterium]